MPGRIPKPSWQRQGHRGRRELRHLEAPTPEQMREYVERQGTRVAMKTRLYYGKAARRALEERFGHDWQDVVEPRLAACSFATARTVVWALTLAEQPDVTEREAIADYTPREALAAATDAFRRATRR